MPRITKSQSKHDSLVRRAARKLQVQGFKVKADVSGFPKPETIGGYRPDVVGTKRTQTKIIEVETPDSKDSARDKGQQQAFRSAALRSKNTTFTRKVTD